MRIRKFKAWFPGNRHIQRYAGMYNVTCLLDEYCVVARESIFNANTFPLEDVFLMQFINRQDINKVDIYEDYIIEANIVEYDVMTMGLILFDFDQSAYAIQNDAGKTLLHRLNKIKIIGNIHENPNIMELI